MRLSNASPDTKTSQQKCVYLDETQGVWVPNECEGVRLSDGEIQCCSTHMTKFSVQTFEIKQGISLMDTFLVPTVVIIDVILVLAALAGWMFDKKGLIYISLQDKEEEVDSSKQQIDDQKLEMSKP